MFMFKVLSVIQPKTPKTLTQTRTQTPPKSELNNRQQQWGKMKCKTKTQPGFIQKTKLNRITIGRGVSQINGWRFSINLFLSVTVTVTETET